LQELAELIDQNEQANREEVLGVIVLLVYCEVVSAASFNENLAGLIMLGRPTRKFHIVNGYLKGAMIVTGAGPQVNTPTSLFLEE
jgi:hypothetical protein